MARPAQEINPKCADRLKQLCHDTGISQAKLAELSGLSGNTISKIITGKSPLTHSVAKLIVDAFPMYRTEWLEGIDDEPMVTGNTFIRSAVRAAQHNKTLNNTFVAAASLCGYAVTPIKSDISASNYVIKDAVTGYTITKGRQSISLSAEEMICFEGEVLDFVALKLRHILAHKELSNG